MRTFRRARDRSPGLGSARMESGFTLIELLVVMIIISILMAVAIPTFLAQKNSARRSRVLQNVSMIRTAMESCSAQNTDSSYTGCAEHRLVFQFEPSRKDLQLAVGAPQHDTEYDINGTGPMAP